MTRRDQVGLVVILVVVALLAWVALIDPMANNTGVVGDMELGTAK